MREKFPLPPDAEGRKKKAISEYRSDSGPGSKASIERAVKKRFFSKETGHYLYAERQFCLPDGIRLTDDERENVDTFVRYAAKRHLVNERHGIFIDRAQHAPEETGKSKTDFDAHDMSHAIGAYILTQQRDVNPAFLLAPHDVHFADANIVVEEYLALLFGGVDLNFSRVMSVHHLENLKSFFGNIPDESIRHRANDILAGVHHDDFSSIFSSYIALANIALRYVATREVKSRDGDAERERQEKQRIIDVLDRASIEATQLPAFHIARQIAQEIFDGKDDPKVLYRIFARECAPILARTSG